MIYKNCWSMVIYIPMNIDGYVPFLINTLDTIVRGVIYAD